MPVEINYNDERSMVTICYNCDISYGENRYDRCPRCGYLTINPPEKVVEPPVVQTTSPEDFVEQLKEDFAKKKVASTAPSMQPELPPQDHEGLVRSGAVLLENPPCAAGSKGDFLREELSSQEFPVLGFPAANPVSPKEPTPKSHFLREEPSFIPSRSSSQKFPIWGSLVDVALAVCGILLIMKILSMLVP